MVSLWEGSIAILHLRTINHINCTLSSVQWHHQSDHILGTGCKNICYLRHETILLLFVHPTSCFSALSLLFTSILMKPLPPMHSGLPTGWERRKKIVKSSYFKLVCIYSPKSESLLQINWSPMSSYIHHTSLMWSQRLNMLINMTPPTPPLESNTFLPF